jgi:hypothetical protein
MKFCINYLFIIISIYSISAFSQTIDWFTMTSGLSTTVKAVAVSGNDVYVGGLFSSAGGVPASRIAKWDGSSWSALGSGVNGEVRAIAVIGTDIYAAGFFSLAGGIPVNNIAKWDGSNWSALGEGVNELVLCLAVNGTELYAGGFFTEAGGIPANRIAKWDGFSWSPLGGGINNEVNAIAVSGNDVYAGGYFNDAGGNLVAGLAKWNGSTWSDIGGGVNGIVRAITVVGSDVYVGGVFTMAGGSVSGRIVRWDGSAWHSLAEGVNGSVLSIQQSGDDLYVGGMFTTAGNQPANRIAKYNLLNSTWSPLGEGATGSVDAMAVQTSTGSMIVGGAFSHVGNNILAKYIARFTDSENPLPVELNSFTAINNGNEVSLSWTTSSEINNKGFEVERKKSEWERIGFVQGYGTTTEQKYYSFTDDKLSPGIYYYRLKQIDYDGSFSYSNAIELDINVVSEFALEQNYPNPFNPSTTITFSIPKNSRVKLVVYDMLGNKVVTLIDDFKPAGSYRLTWYGSNDQGVKISSGSYFYRLETENFVDVKKMLMLK